MGSRFHRFLVPPFALLPLLSPQIVHADPPGIVVSSPPRVISEQLKAPRGLYPASVALLAASARDAFFCSGTLIAPQWVVTAAHCVNYPDAGHIEVAYGGTNWKETPRAQVTKIIVHPEFSTTTYSANIALLQLDHPLDLSPLSISTVAEPAGDIPNGRAQNSNQGGRPELNDAVVAGWGVFFEGEPAEGLNIQRHLSVKFVPRATCNSPDYYGGRVQADQLCAESGLQGIDVCNGFSGAPLMVPESGELRLQGIVIWGEGCARKNKPTVYLNVTAYVDWINQYVKAPLKTIAASPPAPDKFHELTGQLSIKRDDQLRARIADPSANLAPVGLFRYMVSLSLANRPPPLTHFCGGVLIQQSWVLTAAHCVKSMENEPGKVQVKFDTEILDQQGTIAIVKKIVIHPDFNAAPFGNYLNDIALLNIDAPDIRSDMRFPPILSSSTEDIVANANDGTVIGWGKNAFSPFGQISNYLHWTTVHLVSSTSCNSDASYHGLIDSRMICAGAPGVDACQGDSGGPLLFYSDGFILGGLVSWGDGCGKANKPGVYVRVSAFQNWIRSETNR
jgi:secreted trypsin-like serine protease